MIQRQLVHSVKKSIKNKKSILLLGPRQTGKSTLINSLKPDLSFNLAHEPTFLDFARDPNYIEAQIQLKKLKTGTVFIDEIQRIPRLMNTIQFLVDKNAGLQFIMTGSSARKLRRGQANLLPGRIHSYELGPLTSAELDYQLPTQKILSLGTLPGIYTEEDSLQAKKSLKAYTLTYLHEEIKAEALTKNLEGFTRFLFSIAVESTHFLDLAKISRATAVPRQTIQRFFEILEDTLIAKRCDSFAKSDKRRLIQHPRFYIFDNGVLNSLLNNFQVSNDRKGMLFENLFFNQLQTSLSYSDLEWRLSSYRTDAGAEVDYILEIENQIYAIEVKSGSFSKKDLTGFESFKKFVGKKNIHNIIVTPDNQSTMVDDTRVLPWQQFLQELF